VVGTFTRHPLVASDLVLPIDLMDRYFPLGHGQADQTLLRAAPGTSRAALAAAVQRLLIGYPEVTVTDPAAYQRQRAGDPGDLGGVLSLLTALVVLAAAIATLGIANTLALAVVERTRELGLLRAVGMTARQLGATLRWESVITAVAEAAVTLPVGQLLVDLALAGTAGLVAAAVPAHHAARLDLRTAIGVE